MQYKQTLLRLTLLLAPFFSFSQTTYLPQGDKASILLERMEIKGQNDSLLNFSKTRPYSRRSVVYAASILSNTMQLSKVDNYNLNSLYKNNIEWANDPAAVQSKKPVLKNFYKTPTNLYEVHVKDFDLAINPVLQFQFSKENNNGQSLFLNSRGLRLRGRIANKIGFEAYVTDNQERYPLYVQQYENDKKALPGAGFYKDFKITGYDYFDARGTVTFNVTKYIDVAFGYDRNFIGNGQRSLFLSDFGNNNLFLKLNTKIWKFNYQNLFMELHSAEIPGGDKLLPKKYAVMHHLDVNVTKGLNIGLFEGIMFGRRDRFDFGYLNPVIFYRSIEQQNGSFDNSVAGLDFKANVKKRVQLYGQLLLDEFLLTEIKKNDGWWANKWAIQAGAKYIDALGIKNLDVQVEMNRVRPFTYGHRDSVANYTHYNQPLAHPLGANFSELIGIVRYQPAPKWLIQAKAFAWKQGLDSNASSFGSNIFLPNIPPFRTKERGFSLGDGRQSKGMYISFLVSYELRENLFLDLSLVKRKLDITTQPVANTDATIISGGIRWNMHRREFEF